MSEHDELKNDARKKLEQLSFLDDPISRPAEPKRLRLDHDRPASTSSLPEDQTSRGIPPLVLPTRWEHLQPKIDHSNVSLRTIIRPIPQAISVVRNVVEYLRTTGGCQVLVVRADTGSGKTTFLNTLPNYMPDVGFQTQTIDLQPMTEDEFGVELWKVQTSHDGINLIILEGREKPESISDRYIQVVLANINRFARTRRVPLLFVIPTIEEQVARSWCDHGTRVGDLIPEQKLYEGSRWYNFPGVPKSEYIEVAAETIRTLNPPYSIYDFGVSSDEIRSWVDTAPTIGRYIEVLAKRISDKRGSTTITHKGKKEHVWIVYCGPDLRHYDHTYLIIKSLCQDEKLRVAPTKLISPDSDISLAKHWRQSTQWANLVATINFLDIRLINLPITAVVTSALAYADEKLLRSFKEARISNYKEQILKEYTISPSFDWTQPLAERRQQSQNARDSVGRSNLFFLLRDTPAEQQKGGNSESAYIFAQYLHLRDNTHEAELHYYLGLALKNLLEYHQFQGLEGVETEMPLVPNQTDPVPDITIQTEQDTYALEFHFMRKQISSSEISRYAIKNVIEKYMRALPYLSSQLNTKSTQ